ncbi:major facilitator superfamily domain-containing protein 1-like [Xenia sp. Carnegie-2017]|uniref:major facilitator superfamily domain-containing protein 1-like n=1 Tax=Xenia sp. Carnegie-2017 TaxID=2897299 RepID=UPI001F039288|nr:major facilitator superfamily domain-containing protein 1-like [Xenia sp. Carnegie-2017]
MAESPNRAKTDETEPLLDKEKDKDLTGCGNTPLCNPRHRFHRYFFLVFICTLSFGSYFCYDNPGALQQQIEKDMNVATAQYTLLYSLYSWPNVVLSFLGGFLIDRVFGIRLGAILFSLLVLSGQIVFAIGAYIGNFFVMESGRFIFGLGGENLAVAQNTYSVAWFKGKELNFVFGLQLSISRVGSTVNFNVMKPIYDMFSHRYHGHVALGWTLFVGVLFCCLSLLAAFALAFFDRRAERLLKREETKTGEVIRLSDIKDFPLTLWIIFFICVSYYVAVFPFVGLGVLFFEYKYDMTPALARIVTSIIFIVSACASPFFGILVDRFGRNIFWIIFGVLMTLGCHMYMAFTFWQPFVSMVTMGISYSIVACALWPLVALVVPENQLGTAYGIMQSIQNLGLALANMAVGAIVDSKGYLFLEVFFCAWLCLALMSSILLYLADAAKGGKLNLSTKQRQALQVPKAALTLSNEEDKSTSPYSYEGQTSIKPRSAQQLRFRYLSRVGKHQFQVPVSHRSSALAFPHLLK